MEEKNSSGLRDELHDPMRIIDSKSVKLSIIIVHYNTLEMTLECVRSIYENPSAYPFEIIFVDNGSDDDIERKLLGHFPQIRFLEMGSNSGFAKANNLGIFNSHGEYILLLNSDTKVIEPFFDRLIEELDHHSKVGLAGPLHLDGEEDFQLSCGKFPTLLSEMIRKLIHYRISVKDLFIRDYIHNMQSNTKEVDWISGSCMLLRKKALYQTGLLDPAFFMYFEDIDLCTRFRNKGWTVRYIPTAKLIHYGGQSVKGNLLKGLVEYRRSQLYFTEKYYGLIGSLMIRGLLFLKYSFFFIHWSFPYLRDKFLKRTNVNSYVMLLLAKKVIWMTFFERFSQPSEPVFQKSQTSTRN